MVLVQPEKSKHSTSMALSRLFFSSSLFHTKQLIYWQRFEFHSNHSCARSLFLKISNNKINHLFHMRHIWHWVISQSKLWATISAGVDNNFEASELQRKPHGWIYKASLRTCSYITGIFHISWIFFFRGDAEKMHQLSIENDFLWTREIISSFLFSCENYCKQEGKSNARGK